MRIKNFTSSRNTDPAQETTKKNTKVSVFTTVLDQKNSAANTHAFEMAEIKKEIDEAGDKLEQEPNLENFKKFRDLLSHMAKRVGTEAYRLEKIGGTPLNPRYYEVIRVINTEADKLYNLIVNQQRNHIAIVAKVIGIKGLVVNLIS